MTNISLRAWLGDLELTDYPFGLRFGMDLGRPENVYEVMQSLLADGEALTSTRTSNRSMVLPILIEGADMLDLATTEAALIAECEKPLNLLTIDPGDGYGPATVFRVFRAQVQQDRTDEAEMALLRSYTLEIQALPGARSQSPTVIGAEFSADEVAIADDCESTTGWSIVRVGASGTSVQVLDAPVVDSSVYATGTGSVRFSSPTVINPTISGQATVLDRVTKTGLSIDASGGGYFVIRVRSEWQMLTTDDYLDAHLTTSGGGRESVSALVSEADASGFMRLSFPVSDLSTITGFDFQAVRIVYVTMSAPVYPDLWVDSLGLADNSTSAQNFTSFEVDGSMRCEGSFLVSAPAGLGDVLLYTVPDLDDGFRPDLSRCLVTGTTAADADAVTGTRISLASTPTFEASASMLRPGSYAVLARIRRSAAGSCTITLDAQTLLGVDAIGPEETVTSPTITLTDDDYAVVRIGVIELPPLVIDPASTATVMFTASQTGTGYYLDELLVFPLEDHALTWVSCGVGAASATVASRLWIDEPSPTQPRGARLVGNDEGRLDARYVLPESAGRHVLKPGRNLAYLLTSAAGGADLQVSYTAAWHSNAGS